MTAPNAALAYQVLDHIDAHPESWDQKRWWCGTSGCFAGWTVELSGEQINGISQVRTGPGVFDVVHVGERAAQLLGFDGEAELDKAAWAALGKPDLESLDADEFELFSALNTRSDLGRIVKAVFGPRPVDWDKPLKPVTGVPASGCDCSHDGGHGLAPWPDRSRGHAEDCPAFGPRPEGGSGGNVADGGEGGSSEATP